MLGMESPTEVLYHNNQSPGRGQNDNQPKAQQPDEQTRQRERWLGVSREDVPIRNYIDEFAFAFAIPGMILAVLLGLLSAVLCFQHRKL